MAYQWGSAALKQDEGRFKQDGFTNIVQRGAFSQSDLAIENLLVSPPGARRAGLMRILAGVTLVMAGLAGCAVPPKPVPVAASPAVPVLDLPPVGIEKIRAMDATQRADAALLAAAYWVQQKEFGYAEAYLACAEALPEAERERVPDLAGRVGLLRGDIAYLGGDVAGALKRFQRAAEQLSAPGREDVLLAVLIRKEGTEHAHGHLVDGLQTAARIIDLAEAKGNRLLVGQYSYERGMMFFKLGRVEEADRAARRAWEIFTELAFTSGLAECDKLLGNLCGARGEVVKALAHYEAGFAVFKATGNHLEAANCRFNAAQVYMGQGKDELADVFLDEALILFTQAGSVGGVGLCHYSKGVMALQAGDFLKAEKALRTAERMFVEKQNVHRLAQTKRALGDLYRRRGDVSKAVDYFTEADELLDQVENRR